MMKRFMVGVVLGFIGIMLIFKMESIRDWQHLGVVLLIASGMFVKD